MIGPDGSGPCSGTTDTLSIVNAVFNGFQMLLLTFLSWYVSAIKQQNGRRNRRTRDEH